MTETTLYIVRHGKRCSIQLNEYKAGVIHPHKARTRRHSLFRSRVKNVDFSFAYSSDSGRAIETARIILGEHSKEKKFLILLKRIREWCFGSLEGGYDMEMWV